MCGALSFSHMAYDTQRSNPPKTFPCNPAAINYGSSNAPKRLHTCRSTARQLRAFNRITMYSGYTAGSHRTAKPTSPPPRVRVRTIHCVHLHNILPHICERSRVFSNRQDLCRIKWNPDPDQLPRNWFRGHIPDMIKCEMFNLWQADPEKNTAMVSKVTESAGLGVLAGSGTEIRDQFLPVNAPTACAICGLEGGNLAFFM